MRFWFGTSIGGQVSQVWQAWVPAGRSEPGRVALVFSDLHDDGRRVELGAAELDGLADQVLCEARFDEGGVTTLSVPVRRVPKAPPLCWIEQHDEAARPPAVLLHAYEAVDAEAGALAAHGDASMPAAAALGWVRWFPITGLVDDIWVQPQFRRTGIATALLFAAETLTAARGWQRLWADSLRTELADRLRDQDAWRDRAADRSHTTPPD